MQFLYFCHILLLLNFLLLSGRLLLVLAKFDMQRTEEKLPQAVWCQLVTELLCLLPNTRLVITCINFDSARKCFILIQWLSWLKKLILEMCNNYTVASTCNLTFVCSTFENWMCCNTKELFSTNIDLDHVCINAAIYTIQCRICNHNYIASMNFEFFY